MTNHPPRVEDRAHLRGDLSGLRFSTLTMRSPTGHVLDGVVLDANGYGLATLIESNGEHEIPMRSEVELVLRLGEENLRLAAVVRNLSRHDGHDRYGLEFVSPSDVDAQISSAFVRRLLDRRKAERIRISPGEEAPATIHDEERQREVRGTLVDLSVEGACVELPPEGAEGISESERIVLEFRLPGDPKWLGVPGRICQRYRNETASFLSIDFSSHLDESLPFTREAIDAFIEKRSSTPRRAG